MKSVVINWFNAERVIQKETVINIHKDISINEDLLIYLISNNYSLNKEAIRIKGYLVLN